MYDQRVEILTSSSELPVTDSCLSGNDAITLLGIIHTALSCETEVDFKALFPKIQELFPFDFVTVLSGHDDDRFGAVPSYCVNVSFPDEWMREYMTKKYFMVDAILKENFSTYEFQHWSVGRKRLHRLKEITSLGLDFGLRECYTHGSRPAALEKNGSMFCFASKMMEMSRRTEGILKFVVPHLHMALSRIAGNKLPNADSTVLSPREKEVLDWLKQGKSSWDISVILDISERTVNFHVYNIMGKLGATNRPQAVAVAASLGLIRIE
ncbi:MAG: LuxR C-terminal-related transcriptional regulator [Geobacteraceae bacterium]|nr:LuxR C-terminal-related transcriptional regulator [Geobacteraceae bacterium]